MAEYAAGFHTTRMHIGQYSIWFIAIIPLVIIYMGLKKKRDLTPEGKISLNGGIKSGLMISLISAVIISMFLILYFGYINPQYTELGVAYYKEKLILSGKTSIEVTNELDSIKGMFSFINQLLFGVIGTIGLGLLVSVFVSLYFKKNDAVRKNILP